MNNQEAIANLNMIRVAFVEPVTKEQRKLIDDTFDNAIKALEQEPCEDMTTAYLMGYYAEKEPKYCDRNICVSNEYNGIGCSECEVTKSQEPKTQMVDKSNFDVEQYKMDLQCAYDCGRASIEPSDDAVSRQAVLDLPRIKTHNVWGNIIKESVDVEDVKQLPPVNPQEPKTGHCKDCKWWKDSDGAFRRGIGAESQCPINREEVYEGKGYCFLYESQESEEV